MRTIVFAFLLAQSGEYADPAALPPVKEPTAAERAAEKSEKSDTLEELPQAPRPGALSDLEDGAPPLPPPDSAEPKPTGKFKLPFIDDAQTPRGSASKASSRAPSSKAQGTRATRGNSRSSERIRTRPGASWPPDDDAEDAALDDDPDAGPDVPKSVIRDLTGEQLVRNPEYQERLREKYLMLRLDKDIELRTNIGLGMIGAGAATVIAGAVLYGLSSSNITNIGELEQFTAEDGSTAVVLPQADDGSSEPQPAIASWIGPVVAIVGGLLVGGGIWLWRSADAKRDKRDAIAARGLPESVSAIPITDGEVDEEMAYEEQPPGPRKKSGVSRDFQNRWEGDRSTAPGGLR